MNRFQINGAAINGDVSASSLGVASIVLAGEAVGTVAERGQGSAQITFGGAGKTTGIWKASGDAVIRVSGKGAASMAAIGSGDAQITIKGTGSETIASQATGKGQIIISGFYAVPSRLPVPDYILPTHISRIMHTDADRRHIIIEPDPVLPVREKRGQKIQHEDRQA